MEGSFRQYRDLSKVVGRDATRHLSSPPSININFRKKPPYEVTEPSHGHVLSTVRIGLKNTGGASASNCKVYIDDIVPLPALPGGLPIVLNNEIFVLREDDPERLIDIASIWDHVDKYRFAAPLSHGFADALTYIRSHPPRTFSIKVQATECQRKASFRIWVDEFREIHLHFLARRTNAKSAFRLFTSVSAF